MSALGTFYVGQNTLSTHVIKPYYLVSKAAPGFIQGFFQIARRAKPKTGAACNLYRQESLKFWFLSFLSTFSYIYICFYGSRKSKGRNLLNSTLILRFLELIFTENNRISNFFLSVFNLYIRTQQLKYSPKEAFKNL